DRESVPAAIRAGVRDLPRVRRTRKEDSKFALRRTPRRVQILGDAGDGQFRVPKGTGVRGDLMAAPLVLASTTSHKREPLVPTLDLFSRLDLRDLDLNLHHILECDTSVASIAAALSAGGLRVSRVSGGCCEFF